MRKTSIDSLINQTVHSVYTTSEVYKHLDQLEILRSEYEYELANILQTNVIVLKPIEMLVDIMETILILCEAAPMQLLGLLSNAIDPNLDRDSYMLGVIFPMQMANKNNYLGPDPSEGRRGKLLIEALDRLYLLAHFNPKHLVANCQVPAREAEIYSKLIAPLSVRHVRNVCETLAHFT